MGWEKRLLSIRIDSGLFEKIDNYAKAENRSVSNFIETALAQHVNEREAGGKKQRKRGKKEL